jgi:N,N'-diacetyllegionaminate synthase
MSLSPIHIIAEAGTNHNGNPDTALRLVDLAKSAKAQSVKFQIINPEGLYLPAFYENGGYRTNPVIEQRRRFILNNGEYKKIAAYARSLGLGFSASVFDDEGLDLLLTCGPSYVKIASCDLNNISFLRKTAEKAVGRNIPMVLSTGFSTLPEIEISVSEILKIGLKDIVLLHCVSVYPAKLHQMNLGFIDVLKDAFGLPVGLSDHTDTSIAAAVALSKGASYFEKHITLDKSQEGFDHAYALEEADFTQYVKDINDTYEALQHHDEKLSDEEMNVRKRARRSLYAARNLQPGEILKPEDILIVRPEGPMRPGDADKIIGLKSVKHINQYEAFTPDQFQSLNKDPLCE